MHTKTAPGQAPPTVAVATGEDPEHPPLYRKRFDQTHCDLGEHVALENVLAAIDEALGMEVWRQVFEKGIKPPIVVVTGSLHADFTNPVLCGDHLEIRGRIIYIGKSSIKIEGGYHLVSQRNHDRDRQSDGGNGGVPFHRALRDPSWTASV